MSHSNFVSLCLNAQQKPTDYQSFLAIEVILVSAYFLSGIVGGCQFLRWRRAKFIPSEDSGVWKLYGVFSLLVFVGCSMGGLAWLAYYFQVFYFDGIYAQPYISDMFYPEPPDLSGPSYYLSAARQRQRWAQGNQWFSVFYFFYPLEFFVTSFALLLVLDRLTNFILPPQPVLFQQRLKVIQRTVVAFVLGGNVAGVIADFVAVGWYSLIANNQFLYAAELLQMAPSVDPNVTSTDTSAPALASLILQRNDYAVKIGEAVEAQMIIEICVLALIIGAFVLTAVLCFVKLQRSISAAGVLGQNNVARRRPTFIGKLKSVMGHMHNLQFRICFTASFVFVVFVLKIVVAVVVAGSYNKTNTYAFDNACEDADACDPCHSNWYLVSSFLDYRPDIRLIFTLICSPLTLLATLWGMTWKLEADLLAGVPISSRSYSGNSDL